MKNEPLRCQCRDCNTPIAKVQDGVLVIIARHDGEKHVNILKIEDLIKLLQTADIDVTHAVVT
jgi:hypothetical protein